MGRPEILVRRSVLVCRAGSRQGRYVGCYIQNPVGLQGRQCQNLIWARWFFEYDLKILQRWEHALLSLHEGVPRSLPFVSAVAQGPYLQSICVFNQ